MIREISARKGWIVTDNNQFLGLSEWVKGECLQDCHSSPTWALASATASSGNLEEDAVEGARGAWKDIEALFAPSKDKSMRAIEEKFFRGILGATSPAALRDRGVS